MTEEFYRDQILEKMEVTAKLKLPLLVLFGSMALAGIIFNAVTLYIFIVGKASSWKGVRYFVASLAASDVLFSLVTPAFAFFILLNTPSPNSRVLCGLWRLAHESAFFVSLLNTLAIAIERFVVIYFPTVGLSSGRIPRLISIAVIWTVGIAVNFEYAIHTYPVQHPFYKVIMCHVQPRLFLKDKTAFLVLTNIRYFLPVSLILVFYALLAVKVHCRADIGAHVTSTNKVTLKRRNQVCFQTKSAKPYFRYQASLFILNNLVIKWCLQQKFCRLITDCLVFMLSPSPENIVSKICWHKFTADKKMINMVVNRNALMLWEAQY